jgi:hypothetical protein
MMTSKQQSYLARLAREHGYQSLYYAAAKYTGRSISNLQRKGLSVEEASKVIAALQAE